MFPYRLFIYVEVSILTFKSPLISKAQTLTNFKETAKEWIKRSWSQHLVAATLELVISDLWTSVFSPVKQWYSWYVSPKKVKWAVTDRTSSSGLSTQYTHIIFSHTSGKQSWKSHTFIRYILLVHPLCAMVSSKAPGLQREPRQSHCPPRACVADIRLLNKCQPALCARAWVDFLSSGCVGPIWPSLADELCMEVTRVTCALEHNSQGRIALTCPCQDNRRGNFKHSQDPEWFGWAESPLSWTWLKIKSLRLGVFVTVHLPALTDWLIHHVSKSVT